MEQNPRHGEIHLHVRELSQLFDSLDPSPFHEQDLDRNAEEYIVDSMRELRSKSVRAVAIHLDHPSGLADEDARVGKAVRQHFERRSRVLREELRQLIWRGWISLTIGLSFLVAFFFIAQVVVNILGESQWAKLVRESLVIGGWVAMWRPLEIFLYDWWPIVGKRRLYERLSRIEVHVLPGAQPKPHSEALRVD